MFFLDKTPNSLSHMRSQIFMKISKTPTLEFTETIRRWGGADILTRSIEVIWSNDSKTINLKSEVEFEQMIGKIQRGLKVRDLTQSNLDNSDLDGSFMSMKYNLGNSLKKIRITAKLPQIPTTLTHHPQSMTHTPQISKAKPFGSESKAKKKYLEHSGSKEINEPSVFNEENLPETPQLGGAQVPLKFKHSKTQFSGGMDSAIRMKSMEFSKAPSKESNLSSMTDVLAKYAKFLVGQLPPDNKQFTEIIKKNRLPCEKCFDFEEPNKKLGCRYCHKKGYHYMDFQTEVVINLISEKLRSWLLCPIQAFVGEKDAQGPVLSKENSFGAHGKIFSNLLIFD